MKLLKTRVHMESRTILIVIRPVFIDNGMLAD